MHRRKLFWYAGMLALQSECWNFLSNPVGVIFNIPNAWNFNIVRQKFQHSDWIERQHSSAPEQRIIMLHCLRAFGSGYETTFHAQRTDVRFFSGLLSV